MNSSLISRLIEKGYLKDELIIKAFKEIKRTDFVPEEIVKSKGKDFIANYNAPLSIGYGQTISQPLTVAFMLELLQPKPGDKILDIGSGSGWQTAMLCQLVGPKGFVYAIERIPELKDFGQNNGRKYNFTNTEFICGDGSKGLPDKAPFNKIIAAASAKEMSPAWKEQLERKGRLVAPLNKSIWLLVKKSKNKFEEKEYPGFVFVPLIKNGNH